MSDNKITKRTIMINGKEYPAPTNIDLGKFSMPVYGGYYFDTVKDAEDVAKAISDALNGK